MNKIQKTLHKCNNYSNMIFHRVPFFKTGLLHLLVLSTFLIALNSQQINTIIKYLGESCPYGYELFDGGQSSSEDNTSQNGVIECIKVKDTLEELSEWRHAELLLKIQELEQRVELFQQQFEQLENQLESQSSMIQEILSTQDFQQLKITELNTLNIQSSNRIDSFSEQMEEFNYQILQLSQRFLSLNSTIKELKVNQQDFYDEQKEILEQITRVSTIDDSSDGSSSQTQSQLSAISQQLSALSQVEAEFHTLNDQQEEDQNLDIALLVLTILSILLETVLMILVCWDPKRPYKAKNPGVDANSMLESVTDFRSNESRF